MSLILTLVACKITTEGVDTATLCLADMNARAPIELDVDLAPMMTMYGGCGSQNMAVTCDVERDGDTLRFTSTTEHVSKAAFQCESMIRVESTPCAMPPLEAGTYTVEYGDQAVDIELPGTVDAHCITPGTP